MKTMTIAAALAALFPLAAPACEAHADRTAHAAPEVLTRAAMSVPAEGAAVTVSDGHARSTNPSSGAAFMTLTNTGPRDCRLVGVASDVADKVELHTHRDEGGVMKMVPLDGATIPAGGSHALARGGDHVMFMGLRQPLADGDSVALVLDLGDCGTLPVTVPVDNAAGRAGHGHTHGAASH